MSNLLSATFQPWAFIGVFVFLAVIALVVILIMKLAKKTSKAGKMKSVYAQINIGMSKQQVLDLLGKPTGKRIKDGIETYTWKQSEFKGLARGGNIVRAIVIDFENGAVTGYDSDNMDKGVL